MKPRMPCDTISGIIKLEEDAFTVLAVLIGAIGLPVCCSGSRHMVRG